MELRVGRLRQMDTTQILTHEAIDFITWLASNLNCSDGILGVDLELQAEDKRTGLVRADILPKDMPFETSVLNAMDPSHTVQENTRFFNTRFHTPSQVLATTQRDVLLLRFNQLKGVRKGDTPISLLVVVLLQVLQGYERAAVMLSWKKSLPAMQVPIGPLFSSFYRNAEHLQAEELVVCTDLRKGG